MPSGFLNVFYIHTKLTGDFQNANEVYARDGFRALDPIFFTLL